MMPSLFDFICIVFCIIFGFIGYKRGAIKTLISFGGFIASFIIAWLFTASLADYLMGLGAFNALIETLKIHDLAASLVTVESIQGLISTVPLLSTLLSESQNFMTQGVDVIFGVLVRGIAMTLSFGLLMLGTNILVAILQAIFGLVNQLPIIGVINRILGFMMGIVLGGGICFVVISLLLCFNIFTKGSNFPFLESSQLVNLISPWIAKVLGTFT